MPGANLNTPANAVRPSACPGLWRIVSALDGGICRIKLAGGALRADQAEAVAAAAQRHASGVIEATNRANLQIRGVGPQPQALIASLLNAGLGPRDAAGDDVRNLMLSPTAGIDPRQVFDTRPLAAQILHTLETEPRFHGLSAKFAVQLDGGEGLAMLQHHHDLWLSAFVHEGATWLAFGLAGSPGQDPALGAVAVQDGHALVVAVLERFVGMACPQQRRMRDVLAVSGEAVSGGARDASGQEAAWCRALRFVDDLPLVTQALSFKRQPATFSLGIQPQLQSGLSYIAALAPLGRLDPGMLRGAAQLARTFGDGTLRITPWQGLVLPNLADPAPALRELSALGFLVDAQQPLAAMIACTGSAGCAKGAAATKADAVQLASLMPQQPPLSVHLSGCARACAAPHSAPATLLANSPGHYDLYFRDARVPGFGRLQARNISLDAAAALLARGSRSDTDD